MFFLVDADATFRRWRTSGLVPVTLMSLFKNGMVYAGLAALPNESTLRLKEIACCHWQLASGKRA